jgi:hypothetical protein
LKARHLIGTWAGGSKVTDALKVSLPFILVALTFFYPFVFRGRHAVPFNLERSASTAIPFGSSGIRAANRFPKDNSPAVYHYPNAALASESIRQGEIPTWNPYNGCGTPALAGGSVYPFYPFLWPFYAWPNPWVYTLGFLLGSLWAAIGLAMWLRRFLTGWPLGLAVALGVFNPGTARCFGFSSTWADWWIGWLLWSWHAALKMDTRWWWVPVLPMTGTVYCGHPESAFLLAVAGGAYGLFVWMVTEKQRRIGPVVLLGRLAGIGALAVVLAAVHWIPLAGHLPETVSYKFSGAGTLKAAVYGTTQIFNPNTDVYLSAALFALALLGLTRWARVRASWPVLALHGICWFMAFGLSPRGPLKTLLTLGETLPGIYFRGLFWVTLAALAAAGIQALGQNGDRRASPAGRVFALGFVGYVVLLWADYQCGNLAYLMLRRDLLWYDLTAVLFVGLFVVGSSGLVRKAGVVIGVGLVALGPMAIQKWAFPYFSALDPLGGGPPAIAQLKKLDASEHGRMFARNGGNLERSDLEPNLATLWRVRDMRIISPLFIGRYGQLQGLLRAREADTMDTWLTFDKLDEKRLGLFGVSHQADLIDDRAARFDWRPVASALPRAFLVRKVYAARDEDQARTWFVRMAPQFPEGPLREGVIIEGWRGEDAGWDPGASGTVEWIEDGLKTVRLRVTGTSGGLLVLLDTYAEGWRALVDGIPARIYPANLAFRGVAVPAGEHFVEFRYAPRSVIGGLILSGTGWLAVGALVLRAFLSRRSALSAREGGRA